MGTFLGIPLNKACSILGSILVSPYLGRSSYKGVLRGILGVETIAQVVKTVHAALMHYSAYTYACIHMYVDVHIHTYVCVYIYISTDPLALYIHMCVCMHQCIHGYAYSVYWGMGFCLQMQDGSFLFQEV